MFATSSPTRMIEVMLIKLSPLILYTPYEGFKLANQDNRKLGAFDRKLDGSHSQFDVFFINCDPGTHTYSYTKFWLNLKLRLSYSLGHPQIINRFLSTGRVGLKGPTGTSFSYFQIFILLVPPVHSSL